MILENKFNITDPSELAREEEKISKKKAKEMFEIGFLDRLNAGTFESLKKIHEYLYKTGLFLFFLRLNIYMNENNQSQIDTIISAISLINTSLSIPVFLPIPAEA